MKFIKLISLNTYASITCYLVPSFAPSYVFFFARVSMYNHDTVDFVKPARVIMRESAKHHFESQKQWRDRLATK